MHNEAFSARHLIIHFHFHYALLLIMAENDDQDSGIEIICKDNTLCFLLVAVVTAAIVIPIYHVITVCLRKRQAANRRNRRQLASRQQPHDHYELPVAEAQLVPVHKYEKGEGILVGHDDVVCAVCLSEFEEGEELRTLPECLHSFHVQCIDMWLFSHATCPICRANALLSTSTAPQTSRLAPESDRGELRLDSRVMDNILL